MSESEHDPGINALQEQPAACDLGMKAVGDVAGVFGFPKWIQDGACLTPLMEYPQPAKAETLDEEQQCTEEVEIRDTDEVALDER